MLHGVGLVYYRNPHSYADNIVSVDIEDKMNVRFRDYGEKIKAK